MARACLDCGLTHRPWKKLSVRSNILVVKEEILLSDLIPNVHVSAQILHKSGAFLHLASRHRIHSSSYVNVLCVAVQ